MPARYTIRLLLMLALVTFVVNMLSVTALAVVTETLKLVPEDSAPGDDFGESVAVSGAWAVVGAPGNGAGGASYLFNAVTGQEIAKLVPDDLTAGASFGSCISVFGNLAAIGAPAQGVGGAVYVYDLNTGNQITIITAADTSASDWFGSSVSLSGNTLLIGAPGDDDVFDVSGSVYKFDITTSNQLMKLNATMPEAYGSFGESVAYDGGLIAVYDRGNEPSVMLFDPSTGDQLADIAAPAIALVGSSIDSAGDRLLIGAPSVYPSATAGIYDVADPDNITEQIIPWPGGPNDGWYFGHDVSITESVAVVSTWSTADISFSGIVHMFDPDTGDLLESFRPSDASVEDQFGWSIDLDGQTLIVGARGFEETDSGAAYLFIIPEPGVSLIILSAASGWIAGRKRSVV